MVRRIDPVESVKNCIKDHESFVLQGGAGSGKTETLKEAIEFTLDTSQNNVLCITHTNAAVNEIKRRVDGDFDIFTIHSFLNLLIKDFKSNIKEELIEIKQLKKMPSVDREKLEEEKKDYQKERHDLYKNYHEKYSRQLYLRNDKSFGKAEDKRPYDKDYIDSNEMNYTKYDVVLNNEIDQMNVAIKEEMKEIPSNRVHYNNKKFDSIKNMTYGHDSLLIIASNLINKHPKLQRILQHKYDYIFIDEYQDTNPSVLGVLLDKFISETNTIGLFGDGMQAIYDDGIGDVNKHIENEKIREIQKEDNYRSSFEVVDFINRIRTDNLEQEVVLKGNEECSDRIGNVTFHYVIKSFEQREKEEKKQYLTKFKQHVLQDKSDYVQLELSNTAIANEMGYTTLYNHYKSMPDVNDAINEDLTELHLKELYEIIEAFKKDNHNFVIEKLKYNGWILREKANKKEIIRVLTSFSESNLSVNAALETAFSYKVLKESDGYIAMKGRKRKFFKDLDVKENFQEFKRLYNREHNTFNKISKVSEIINSVEQFNHYLRLKDREEKYLYLDSENFKLKEAFNFFEYQLHQNNISTMHKTKGEGIKNVALVLENYQWNKYNFDKMFDDSYQNSSVKSRTQKLFYVACSRAIKNLKLLKVIKDKEELELFIEKFGSDLFIEVKTEDI